MVLCHGWPTLTGGPYEGQRYGHAWVERTIEMRMPFEGRIMKVPIEECWDTLTDTWLPKALYYIAGKINAAHVTTYNYPEACAMMNDSDTYGPWQEPPHAIAPYNDEEESHA